MTIILTIALCYIATGIYTLLVFDHADLKRGWKCCDFRGQVYVVLTWPRFLYVMAHEDDYLIEIGDE